MKKSGFTLIEIMIVVAIIATLASLTGMGIRKSINNSKIKTAETELEMISTAILQLAWDTGKWPNQQFRTGAGSTEVWDLSGIEPGLTEESAAYDSWKGPYYGGAMDDPWGNPYFFDPDYTLDGESKIVVGSFGPNGEGPNQYDDDDVLVLLGS